MALVPFLQLFAMLAVCVLAGQPVARRLNLDALHRTALAALSGVVLIFTFEFIGWVFCLPPWFSVLFVTALCGWSLLLLIKKNCREQFAIAWDGLALWTALGLWILAAQFQIVVYGGVTWFGDWYEHYERSIFFLDHLPPETRFHLGIWTLPARGPIFNAAAAFFMRMMGRDFASYQVFATGLNTLAVLPMALLLRDVGRLSQKTSILLSAALFGLSPFAVQHEVFTATKFLTVAYILSAIHFHLLGLRKESTKLAAWSLTAFVSGVLVHYLTVLIAPFFVVHLGIRHFRLGPKDRSWVRPFVLPVICSVLLLGLWFGTCFALFGIRATLQANSTLGGSYAEMVAEDNQDAISWPRAFAGNLLCTTVPYGWRHGWQGLGNAERVVQADMRWGEEYAPRPGQQNRLAEWFCDLSNSACSLSGGLGWAGVAGLIISCGLYWRKKSHQQKGDSRIEISRCPAECFWIMFAFVGIPLNILASRDYQSHGIAHLNLMPFICLAVVWMASEIQELKARWRWAIGLVFVMESLLTTGAIVYLQARPVPIILKAANKISIIGELGLNTRYVDNYFHKLKHGAEFLSDRLGESQDVASFVAAAMAVALMIAVWRFAPSQRRAPTR